MSPIFEAQLALTPPAAGRFILRGAVGLARPTLAELDTRSPPV